VKAEGDQGACAAMGKLETVVGDLCEELGITPPDAAPPRRPERFDPSRRSEAATSPKGVNSDHLEADFYRFVAFSTSATKLSINFSGVLRP
jgi:hypothetical protein